MPEDNEDGSIESAQCGDEGILYDLRVREDGCEVFAIFDGEVEGFEQEIPITAGLAELDETIEILQRMRAKILTLPAAQQGAPSFDGEDEEEEEDP